MDDEYDTSSIAARMRAWVGHLRWRLAKWVAPVPILAAPGGDGPAILMAAKGNYATWLHPKTLDVKMETRLQSLEFDPADPVYRPTATTGTITGTI